jgi:hypothetical protein
VTPEQPLVYPPHYPPTDRVKRFFIGVRWLGPDLSFFGALRAVQGARSIQAMATWGGGEREALAFLAGRIFARRLRWPGRYFIPADRVAVIAGGPCFRMLDGGLDARDAAAEIEASLGLALGRGFWASAGAISFGELVDRLLEAKAAGDRGADRAAGRIRIV